MAVKALINGTILHEGQEIAGKALLFDQQILGIVAMDEVPDTAERIDAKGQYISPGLIDLHIHGYLGEDASDGELDGLLKVAKHLPENGVTGFLPTTMTVSWDEVEQALDNIRTLKTMSEEDAFTGSQVLGAHAEGPFINPKRKGAQAEEHILAPDAERMLKHKDIVRLVTMAPEMPGGLDFIREIRKHSDMVVSIGHTDASFELVMEAIHAGASYVTHLFNAMTALGHRAPGVVGAALSAKVYTELIADTFHVHQGLYPLLHQVKGKALVLVTDCTRAGGLGDGEYTLGGQAIFVKGVECRLADGTIAGSVLRLNEAVRNLRDHGGLSTAQAVLHASLIPARAIGLDERKGSLHTGKDADIVLFDQNMQAQLSFVRGRLQYRR